ncbi:hypothetical protein Ddc_13157 [Ditylenchus destructor]|nr:hypothetical protein Ddc_13157 [Ditylenchus destructor]
MYQTPGPEGPCPGALRSRGSLSLEVSRIHPEILQTLALGGLRCSEAQLALRHFRFMPWSEVQCSASSSMPCGPSLEVV